MKQWEYRVVEYSGRGSDFAKELDTWGTAGWEAVSAGSSRPQGILTFFALLKREKN